MTRNPVSRRTALKRISAGAGALAVLPFLSDEGLAAYADIQKAGAAPSLKVLTEFVGCKTTDGKDCPHCGQKAEG